MEILGMYWLETDENKKYIHRSAQKQRICEAYRHMVWLTADDEQFKLTLHSCAGISAALDVYKYPAVAVSESERLSPLTMFGLRGRFVEGYYDTLFLIDGPIVTPICTFKCQEGDTP